MRKILLIVVVLVFAAGAFAEMPIRDWGYPAGRAKVDFNGDGNLDYCRVIGNGPPRYVLCSLSSGPKVEDLYAGADVRSSEIDWGYEAGRAWVDFNGDGKADYCRVIGQPDPGYRVACLLSQGNSFGADVVSHLLDRGYEDTQVWMDANEDGKADFCRVVGNHREFVRCTFSFGSSFNPRELTDLKDK